MTEPEGFRERLAEKLSHVTPSHVGAVSGAAMLCAASALALAPDTWPTVLPWMGAIGQNVLGDFLQQQIQDLAGEPGVDERERLAKLARALQGEIERDAWLRVEVGAFLDELDAVAIAEEVLRGNQAVHGWLLVHIRRDVMQYGAEFARTREALAWLEAALAEGPAQPGGDVILGRVGEGARNVAIGENIQMIDTLIQTQAEPAQFLHQLPAPPADFTGRDAELAELCQALEAGGGATICGLRGLGGIGKTALALKLAAQLTPRYPDAQFIVDPKEPALNPWHPPRPWPTWYALIIPPSSCRKTRASWPGCIIPCCTASAR